MRQVMVSVKQPMDEESGGKCETRGGIVAHLFQACVLLAVVVLSTSAAYAATKPNLLLITVDDMNADSVGVFGAQVSATTPHIDQLAREGLRFAMAHVQVANCTPSRNVMWSGRYPHSNKVLGFDPVRNPGYPVLADLLRDAGYFTAIRHKVTGSTPYAPYNWDLVLDDTAGGVKLDVKDAASYGRSTARAITAAKAAGKPFSVMINISDPHVPFAGLDKEGNPTPDPFPPSRTYRPSEVVVPGFLPDDPVVRKEVAYYYNSVRRADDGVGAVLRALDTSGEAKNTLVLFLSDHGMPFPFAKTQLYHQSTRTPLIIRWPGVTSPGAVDQQHMVSAVDILPTLLESIGAPNPEGIQGRSFLGLLRGESQSHRDRVYKAFHQNAARHPSPSRAVQSPRYLYLFNAWSDGKHLQKSHTDTTASFARMLELAKSDKNLAARIAFYQHRTPDELYDIAADPNCLKNLVASSKHQMIVTSLRKDLADWMVQTNDPMQSVFAAWVNEGKLTDYVPTLMRQAQDMRKFRAAIRASLKSKSEANERPVDSVPLEVPHDSP